MAFVLNVQMLCIFKLDAQIEAIRLEETLQRLALIEEKIATLPLQIESVLAQQQIKRDIIELKEKGTFCILPEILESCECIIEELSLLQQSHEYRVSTLMKGVDMYRKYLGLDFRVLEGLSASSAPLPTHFRSFDRDFLYFLLVFCLDHNGSVFPSVFCSLRLAAHVCLHTTQSGCAASGVHLCACR